MAAADPRIFAIHGDGAKVVIMSRIRGGRCMKCTISIRSKDLIPVSGAVDVLEI